VKNSEWLADRQEMSGLRWSSETLNKARPEALSHARKHFNIVETALMADGRNWILDTPSLSLADIHGIWPFDWALQPGMIDSLPKNVISESVFPKTFAWVERFRKEYEKALNSNGKPAILEGKEALAQLLAGGYFESEGDVDGDDPLGLVKGQEVEVYPTDMASGYAHRDTGKLIGLTMDEVVIQTSNNGGEDIRIHFPRTNFRISKTSSKL
jgi:hypothetical protein